jgi:hypothetical protein
MKPHTKIAETKDGYFLDGRHLCNLKIRFNEKSEIKVTHCDGSYSFTLDRDAFQNLASFEKAARFCAAHFKRHLVFNMNKADFEALIKHFGFELFYKPDSQPKRIRNIDDHPNCVEYRPFSRRWAVRLGRRLKEQGLWPYQPESMSQERFERIMYGQFPVHAELDTPRPELFTTPERNELERLNHQLDLNERALYQTLIEMGDLECSYRLVTEI